MSKKKITTNQVGIGDRELRGLKDEGQLTFRCNDCNLVLLVLQLVTTSKTAKSKVLTRVAVECGDCGGYSDVEQVVGQFFPGAPNDDMIFEPIDGDENTPITDVLFMARKK